MRSTCAAICRHRILRGVEDRAPRCADAPRRSRSIAEMPVGGPVADEVPSGGPPRACTTSCPEIRAGRSGGGSSQHDAHQLPVPRDRVLAWAEGTEPAEGRRRGGPRDARRAAVMLPSPSRSSVGNRRPPTASGEVTQRVAPRIAIFGGVAELPDAEGVDHENECAAWAVRSPAYLSVSGLAERADARRSRRSSGAPRTDGCRAASSQDRRGRASPAASAGRSPPSSMWVASCGAECAG